MVLEDWKLMRTRQLKQLDKAVKSYQQYISEQGGEKLTMEEAEARWKLEAELMARIHEAVHQLRDALSTDIFLTHEVAGSPLKELPNLSLEKPADIFVDYSAIRGSLPGGIRKMSAQRSTAALSLVDKLMTYVLKQLRKTSEQTRNRSSGNKVEDEARALFEFLVLVGHYPDRSVAHPETHDFAEEIWKMLDRDDDMLYRELKEMTPPVTWGETLYHFLRDLETHRGDPDADRQRKHVAQYLFPVREFYCVECDRPFPVDNRHPGRFICGRCRAKDRKRRERQRQRDNKSRPATSSKA